MATLDLGYHETLREMALLRKLIGYALNTSDWDSFEIYQAQYNAYRKHFIAEHQGTTRPDEEQDRLVHTWIPGF